MHLRARDIKAIAAWVLGAGLLGASAVVVIRAEEKRVLEQNAEQAARQWAQLASMALPSAPALTPGTVLLPPAREHLLQLTRLNNIFRFRIFDPQGGQILSSSDLSAIEIDKAGDQAGNKAGEAVPVRSLGVDKPDDSASLAFVRDTATTGKSIVQVQRGAASGWPAVYSEAYVPLGKAGAAQGVAQVYVDQSALAASTRDGLVRVTTLVAGVLLLGMAIAIFQSSRRLRIARRARARYQEIAHADNLTGSLNRVSFNEVLQEAAVARKKGGSPFALICIDLDNFKEINDTLGHAAGDQALRETTQRIQGAVRDGDYVARLGGDEFAVLLMNVEKRAAVATLAHRVVQRLAEPLVMGGFQFSFGGSAGIAMYGTDAKTPEELMVKADLALYRAKETARGQFIFYDADMDVKLQSRRELVRDLGQAIEAKQLEVHYQPLFEADGDALVGYEALLRWHHPTRGMISPAEFISLAEDNGLIGKIGQWVLMQACQDATGWPASLTVHVNVSPAQFADTKLVAKILAVLQLTGLPAKRLGLEITESLLVNNTEQVSRVLTELTKHGISLAMDDFGTGYSSLAYLWRFPFGKVKIDRAFTSNLDSNAKVAVIVRSIISMAHALDIRVNAEGVETEDQINLLRSIGCDELQGFGLGKPMPNEALTHQGHVTVRLGEQEDPPPRESLFAGLNVSFPNSRSGGL
jgi:diguanylate cyclase (GGDEF)-like protein